MAARTLTRSSGAYATDGSTALQPDRDELIKHAQELRRRRLLEQHEQKQGLSLRTKEHSTAAVQRRHVISQWMLPASMCALAILMLVFMMFRHVSVARGAIIINNQNARLKEIKTSIDRATVDLSMAGKMDDVKKRADAMGFNCPAEDRIIRVTLPDASPATPVVAQNAQDENLLDYLLGAIKK